MLPEDLADHCRAVRHAPTRPNAFEASRFQRRLLQSWCRDPCFVLTTFVITSLDAANGKLQVRFFDIGQGDAILVSCPEGKHHLLIDSGDTRYPNSSKNLRAFLSDAFNVMTSDTSSVIIRDLSAGVSEFVQRAFGRASQKLSLSVSKPNLAGK